MTSFRVGAPVRERAASTEHYDTTSKHMSRIESTPYINEYDTLQDALHKTE